MTKLTHREIETLVHGDGPEGLANHEVGLKVLRIIDELELEVASKEKAWLREVEAHRESAMRWGKWADLYRNRIALLEPYGEQILEIQRIVTYVQNREADAGCADTDDMIAAYMNIAEIVFP